MIIPGVCYNRVSMTDLLGSVLASTADLAGQQMLLSYALVFVSTILLGNISAFAALWLAFQGSFGPGGIPAILIVLFLSDLTADLLWYSLGRALAGTRFGSFIENHLPGAKKVQEYLGRRGVRLIFLAKFLYASNFIILFSVGWIKMDFNKYFRASLLAVLLWLPFVTALTSILFAGLSLVHAQIIVKHLEVIFLVGLVLFVAINHATKWFIRRSFEKSGR